MKKVIIILCAVVVLVGAIFAGKYFIEKQSDDSGSADLPSQSDNSSDTTDILNAYQKVIESFDQEPQPDEDGSVSITTYIENYALYDVDGNGVAELIVRTGLSETNYEFLFYTFENGQSKLLCKEGGWHTTLYKPAEGEGVIFCVNAMGYDDKWELSLSHLTFQGDNQASTELYNGLVDEDMEKELFNKYCGDEIAFSPDNSASHLKNMIE